MKVSTMQEKEKETKKERKNEGQGEEQKNIEEYLLIVQLQHDTDKERHP